MKTATALLLTASSVSGFAVLPLNGAATSTSSTALNGLFDGVKEAFSASSLERSKIDSERETPIDRWMGWSVASQNEPQVSAAQQKAAADFVDSMDEANYVAVSLAKPMGIVFEENDSEYGGIFIQSLKEGGNAAKYGVLKSGDQLVCVGDKNVSALDFDDALGAILDSTDDETKLTSYRGTAKQFYGPTGPSQEWLAKFCEKTGVEVTPASAASS
jgi:C-terminal processing protease CtpA/Prc